MSDRIAVMHEGRVDQVGTPREIYEGPATLFVADFLGVANVMEVEVVSRDGPRLPAAGRGRASCGRSAATSATGAASAVVRPERLRVMPHAEAGENCLPGMIDRTDLRRLQPAGDGRGWPTAGCCRRACPNDGVDLDSHEQGAPVSVHVPPDALRVLRRGYAATWRARARSWSLATARRRRRGPSCRGASSRGGRRGGGSRPGCRSRGRCGGASGCRGPRRRPTFARAAATRVKVEVKPARITVCSLLESGLR